MTDEADSAEIQRLTALISQALKGEPLDNCIAALATFQSFLICAVAVDSAEALVITEQLHEQMTGNVTTNYERYHSQWLKNKPPKQ